MAALLAFLKTRLVKLVGSLTAVVISGYMTSCLARTSWWWNAHRSGEGEAAVHLNLKAVYICAKSGHKYSHGQR